MRVKSLPVVPADAPDSDDYTIGSPKDQWLTVIKGQNMNVDKLMEANKRIAELERELKTKSDMVLYLENALNNAIAEIKRIKR